MLKYTTGELAKLCNVSVRTVQFYDTKNLLKPSEISEGGRRLYTEADVKKLSFICLLKTLSLNLEAIKQILEHADSNDIILSILDEQLKQLKLDIESNSNDKIGTAKYPSISHDFFSIYSRHRTYPKRTKKIENCPSIHAGHWYDYEFH